jgi:hypothetical protein
LHVTASITQLYGMQQPTQAVAPEVPAACQPPPPVARGCQCPTHNAAACPALNPALSPVTSLQHPIEQMAPARTSPGTLLVLLLVAPLAVSAHRHLHDDDGTTDTASAVTQAALGAPAEFDPTPGPLNFDPAQAGKRNGFYRCVRVRHASAWCTELSFSAAVSDSLAVHLLQPTTGAARASRASRSRAACSALWLGRVRGQTLLPWRPPPSKCRWCST